MRATSHLGTHPRARRAARIVHAAIECGACGTVAGLVPTRAEDTNGATHETLGAVVEETVRRSVPGVSVAVVTGDGKRSLAAGGLADLARGTAARVDTLYLWFSMTKLVTATAAMTLVDDGRLDLDEPVRRWLPEFPPERDGARPVRVRHLLSHSSGLANPMPLRWVHLADQPGLDSRELTLRLLRRHRRLRFPPGQRASYSNLGYLALGEVIAAAAGRPFNEHVRDRVLRPLEMATTGFGYPVDATARRATGYHPRRSPMTPLLRALLPPGILGPRAGRFVSFQPFLVDGAAYGGHVGSVEDAGRFLASHLDQRRSILSSASREAMQRIAARGRRLEVALGWYRRGRPQPGQRHLEHLGGGAGFWNMMRLYPDLGLGVVTMGNATRYDHEAIARAVTQLTSA
jgi:CubicO group peptidase (beta-lactamase class C family)